MDLSVFDLFRIGIGPSSSHTVGPMRAAASFAGAVEGAGHLDGVTRVHVELFGSLAATGTGHGTRKAVMLGLEGADPETVDVASIPERLSRIRQSKAIRLAGRKVVGFNEAADLELHGERSLPRHPNGMIFTAYGADGSVVYTKTCYSIGGGFVVDEGAAEPETAGEPVAIPYPFATAEQLLSLCDAHGLTVSELMWANETARRPAAEVRARLGRIWEVMQECVEAGCRNEGVLPGGLNVQRRAPALFAHLRRRAEAGPDSLAAMDWVCLFAIATNEENAAGGRVVTAPTNGAAGIVPAVLHYYARFVPGARPEGIEKFLLTAAAIGILYKTNASISGAEVGCQGEVGSACSMAAGALAEVLGGTPRQVENAAEIGMEHNLGLTCDPIGGLVQIPCIERNAMAAVKAISAARLALSGDGTHFVSLDKVIKTMRETGRDMQDRYKETARGGLAVNVPEVPVNIIDC